MPSDAPRLTAQVLRGSSFGSNFRQVSVAIVLNLFWVIFHGMLPQMLSNLYKSFTSDALN